MTVKPLLTAIAGKDFLLLLISKYMINQIIVQLVCTYYTFYARLEVT